MNLAEMFWIAVTVAIVFAVLYFGPRWEGHPVVAGAIDPDDTPRMVKRRRKLDIDDVRFIKLSLRKKSLKGVDLALMFWRHPGDDFRYQERKSVGSRGLVITCAVAVTLTPPSVAGFLLPATAQFRRRIRPAGGAFIPLQSRRTRMVQEE